VEDGPVVFVVELLVETQYRLQCTKCQKLVHRKCSGIKSSMIKEAARINEVVWIGSVWIFVMVLVLSQ